MKEEDAPPTTIEELWARVNTKLDRAMDSIRKDMREEGDPWLHSTVVYLKQLYADYRRSD